MSNSKVRPAAGLSRRELLQRGSLGTAGVLSLGALVTLLDACSSGGSSAASGPLPAALGGGGIAALVKKAKDEGRLNVLGHLSDRLPNLPARRQRPAPAGPPGLTCGGKSAAQTLIGRTSGVQRPPIDGRTGQAYKEPSQP